VAWKTLQFSCQEKNEKNFKKPLDKLTILCYIVSMKNEEMTIQQEAQLLLNNEVKVTDHRSEFCGRTGIVTRIMADGRTLEVDFFGDSKQAFLDVTLVSEIRELTKYRTEQSLGPIANHLVKDTL
tara:strand:- start:1366 stop:1740 length:375 start_codon:yes stop_codon:yes gene_type:complete